MYKAVFIDLDDTLWDFHANARISLQEMYTNRGLNRHFDSFDEFFEIYAKRNIELWESYGKGEITKDYLMLERFRYPLSRMGVDDLELAHEIGHQYLEILPTQKTLMPHALEVLDYLKERYSLTIISNGFTEVQYKKLKSSGLAHYFNHVVLSEQAGALKPDPRIFTHALHLNDVEAHEAIMIGDSYEADIRGAQASGIDQVYFPLHGNAKPHQTATYRIDSLKELMQIL